MGTDLYLEPTLGKLLSVQGASNPSRLVRVISSTKDGKFSSDFVELIYLYGDSGAGPVSILFDDIDMVVDALLEHQAARKGRLEEALTIGEAEKRRLKYRAAFMERGKK